MRLVRATPNPRGGLDALWLLEGDAHTGPVATIAGDPEADLPAATGTRRLRLFHFNDLHNYLQAPAPSGDLPLFSRIVARCDAARRSAAPDEAVLLLSGGDDHTGTALDELLGWRPEDLVVDPAYAAYAAAGVDAATLGNHDLDRGGGVLAAGVRASARFPILSANIHGAGALVSGRDYHPGAIAVARGLRIGFIGLTTAIDTRTATAADPDLRIASPRATLRHLLPALADRCDLVIVMSHCGYGFDDPDAAAAAGVDFLAEGDVALARLAATLTERPVLVLGGHSHTVLNAQGLGPATLIAGVPIIQAGGQGSHVGEFRATLTPGGTRAQWTVAATLHPLRGAPRGGDSGSGSGVSGSSGDTGTGTGSSSGENGNASHGSNGSGAGSDRTARGAHHAGAAGSAAAAPDFDTVFEAAVVAPLVAQVRARMDETVAINEAGAAVSQTVTLRQRYAGECALANFVCDALVARSRNFPQGPADLAIVNATAIAAGLPDRADITFNDLYRMLPFADCLQVCRMRGADLLAILRSNAARILRPEEIAAGAGVDAGGYVSRGFLHFSKALRYTLALGGSAADATIAEPGLDGVALEQLLERTLTVVFTNYLGAGGYREAWNGSPIGSGVPGGIAGFDLRPLPKRDTGLVFRNEVIAHARTLGRIGPATGAALDGRLTLR